MICHPFYLPFCVITCKPIHKTLDKKLSKKKEWNHKKLLQDKALVRTKIGRLLMRSQVIHLNITEVKAPWKWLINIHIQRLLKTVLKVNMQCYWIQKRFGQVTVQQFLKKITKEGSCKIKENSCIHQHYLEWADLHLYYHTYVRLGPNDNIHPSYFIEAGYLQCCTSTY